MPAAISSSIDCTYSGSPTPRIMFVSSKIRLRLARGMPIMSQMICSGSAAAISLTKSHSPPRSTTRSTISRACSRTFSSILRDLPRREAAVRRSSRSFVCFGASMLIIEPSHSAISGGMSPMLMLGAEWNVSGSRLTCITSA